MATLHKGHLPRKRTETRAVTITTSDINRKDYQNLQDDDNYKHGKSGLHPDEDRVVLFCADSLPPDTRNAHHLKIFTKLYKHRLQQPIPAVTVLLCFKAPGDDRDAQAGEIGAHRRQLSSLFLPTTPFYLLQIDPGLAEGNS